MSQILKGILGALAVLLTLGAVQFASGHDLIGRDAAPAAPEIGVNRAAKADRDTVPLSRIQTRTVVLRLDSLAETSVLLRVPVTETRARPVAPSLLKSGKAAIACEPMVSVLTEVAKQLQPGRCMT